MATEQDLRDLDTELTRVVDRLNSMPLTRAVATSNDCYAVTELMLELTRSLTDQIPVDATLPRLEAHGLGSLTAVVGRDYEEAVKAAPQSVVRPVVDRLIELRRSLP